MANFAPHKERTSLFKIFITGIGQATVSAVDEFHAIDKLISRYGSQQPDRNKYIKVGAA